MTRKWVNLWVDCPLVFGLMCHGCTGEGGVATNRIDRGAVSLSPRDKLNFSGLTFGSSELRGSEQAALRYLLR